MISNRKMTHYRKFSKSTNESLQRANNWSFYKI